MFEIVGGLITLGAATDPEAPGEQVIDGFWMGLSKRSLLDRAGLDAATARRKLRFVDAVKSPMAPVIAGGAAAVLAAFPVALLPFVGAGTAILFGAGVGAGVASGKSDIEHHRLNP